MNTNLELIRENGISNLELQNNLEASLGDLRNLKKVLLVVPDNTRSHSRAGDIAEHYYNLLKDTCDVDVLIALGTHVPMSSEECAKMFGEIPYSKFIHHNWRTDVVNIGKAPKEFVEKLSEGFFNEPIDFEINKRLLDPSYDLILSIGQVVPHEVVGMANYTKNLLVGCGGSRIINASHILGAIYGMERMMGKDKTPVRRLFDYGEENFLKALPLKYVLTVTTSKGNDVTLNGLFIGRDRALFEHAASLSQKRNLIFTDEPFKKVVVYLDANEFKSTWLGNKAIYRTRMAIADEGELIIIAPGVKRFGEDSQIDSLVRKYGYNGKAHTIKAFSENDDLKANLSAAAHLIHGSSEGRFKITYCPGFLTKAETESVGFSYMELNDALKLYDPKRLIDGFNDVNGENIFYISNPALGLWADRAKF